jgi:hypothetical protein
MFVVLSSKAGVRMAEKLGVERIAGASDRPSSGFD